MGGCVVESERATLGDESSIKKAIAVWQRYIQQTKLHSSWLSTLIKKKNLHAGSIN